MELDQLIKSCAKKNRRAREELYHKYEKKLFQVCLKYCRSHEEAEDHLHDVFINVFENIKKYKGQGSFEGWMKRIAINMAIDKYKKKKTYHLKEERIQKFSEDVTIAANELTASIEDLMALIRELPDQYRLVFNLYQLDNYSHKQIARMLNISEGTSKSNLHRAKIKLKEKVVALKNRGAVKDEK
ncbi:MAG: sigma-70 family RNA polymerase sigma factor [Bacteroidota bacterium]